MNFSTHTDILVFAQNNMISHKACHDTKSHRIHYPNFTGQNVFEFSSKVHVILIVTQNLRYSAALWAISLLSNLLKSEKLSDNVIRRLRQQIGPCALSQKVLKLIKKIFPSQSNTGVVQFPIVNHLPALEIEGSYKLFFTVGIKLLYNWCIWDGLLTRPRNISDQQSTIYLGSCISSL